MLSIARSMPKIRHSLSSVICLLGRCGASSAEDTWSSQAILKKLDFFEELSEWQREDTGCFG